MASNELERAANSMESGVRQIRNGLEQVRNVIEYYNVHGLQTEMDTLADSDQIVTTGNSITKGRLVDLAFYADSALKLIYDVGDGSGNTLLGRAGDTPAQMQTREQEIAI